LKRSSDLVREGEFRMNKRRGVSRRQFIASASVATAATVVGCGKEPPPPKHAPNSSQLLKLTAVEAVAALTRGEITAERYSSTLLAQCERHKSLNAFITLEPAKVLEAARAADRLRNSGGKLGPLHGLPIPIKDSVNTKDLPTTAGTPALRNFHPQEDAPIVRTLVGAGAIILGKTNLHELSWGWTSNNFAFGAVHNPYDAKRIPGGSSGGTAATIAARMAPVGIAEDTEGSIRVPAAMCGIAGFRPTTSRYPTTGVVPISAIFDQVGPHARSVADLALVDSVVTGNSSTLSSAALKGLKLGVARGYWFTDLDPEVSRIAEAALGKFREAGVEIVESEVPDLARLIELTTVPIQNHDVSRELTKYLTEYKTGVTFAQLVAQTSSDIKVDFARNVLPGGKSFVSDAAYRAACDVHLPKLRENFRTFFAETGVAAIVFPATMVPPPLIGNDIDVEISGKKVPFEIAVARNIAPGSTAGLPGLVLPAGLTSNGLPVALEFDAPAGSDRVLLSLGLSLEYALGPLPAPAY
jgi:Asp-tRNA(Asn)/Glu-tRNA(Gln) amidotransferase A subunit family amidase